MTTTLSRDRVRPPRRALLALIAAVVAAVAILGAAEPAFAHAVLVASDPVNGSEVATSPARVTLEFDEVVQLVPDTARVISSTGARADTGRATTTAGGTRIEIPLRPHLARGSYTVTWRVVSADTHIVSGSIAFGVRQPAGAVATTTPTTSFGPLDIASQAAVGVGYVGVILLLGMGATARLLWPAALSRRRVRVLMRGGWGCLVAGGIVQLLLAGPRATASGWAGVVRLDGVGETIGSPLGVLLLARLALLAVIAACAGLPAAVRTWLLPASAVGVLVTIAMAGHAGTGADAPLAVTATVLHLASMATWIGGLLVLLVAVLPGIRAAADTADARLDRWSVTAFTSVAVLVTSGEYQAWREVRPAPALWSTPYGVTLLAKLALVAVALGLGLLGQRAIARRRVRVADAVSADAAATDAARTARAATTDPREDAALTTRLRRSMRWEVAAVAAVLVVTTALTALPPASATYGPPARLTAPLAGAERLVVRLDTTRHGPVEITATVEDASGAPVSADAVDATLSSTQNDVAAIAVRMRRDHAGWRSVDAVVPLAGAWTLTFDVSIDTAAGYATSAGFQAW